MKRRDFLRKAGTGAAGLAVASLPGLAQRRGAAQNRRANQPNILFFFADDWGVHASAYGTRNLETPAFDRVAANGALFQNAFADAPSCTPSRTAVLTGQHFYRTGPAANLWAGTFPSELATYPKLLADAGYAVGHTGKGWGPGSWPQLDHNPAGPRQEEGGSPSADTLAHFLSGRSGDQPFCFWYGTHDPHREFTHGVHTTDVEVPPYLPDTEGVRRDIGRYYAEITDSVDPQLDAVLRLLEEAGALENTLLVVTSDHGWPFPRSKTQLYDAGTRVPLAVQWPARMEKGREITDFVNLSDLAPTFLRAAGIEVPDQMTGRPLLEVLLASKAGRVDSIRDHVVVGRERHTQSQEEGITGGYPMRAIRTDEHLYIRNFEPDRWPQGTPDWQNAEMDNAWLSDCDNGPTKFAMWAGRNDEEIGRLYDLAFAKRPAEELYVLADDPHQISNVATDPARAEVKQRLRGQLMSALEATEDPRVTAPPGVPFADYPYAGGAPSWPGEQTLAEYAP